MNYNFRNGQKLRITLLEGDEYEGKYHSANKTSERLSMYAVTDRSTGTFFDSMYTFYRNEIRDIKIVDGVSENEPVAVPPAEVVPSSASHKPKRGPSHHTPDNIDLPREEAYRLQMLKKTSRLIDKYDQACSRAVRHLLNVETVALHGWLERPDGPLDILAVATWNQIYLFDMKRLGHQAFGGGLDKILSCRQIVKVLHGGVDLARCLRRYYGIKLDNVFDTQVCDTLVEDTGKGRSLAACLETHLAASREYLEHMLATDETPEERPFSDYARQRLCQGVGWLITLRARLQQALNADFHVCTERYMQHVVTMDPGTAYQIVTSATTLPDQVQNLSITN